MWIKLPSWVWVTLLILIAITQRPGHAATTVQDGFNLLGTAAERLNEFWDQVKAGSANR